MSDDEGITPIETEPLIGSEHPWLGAGFGIALVALIVSIAIVACWRIAEAVQ